MVVHEHVHPDQGALEGDLRFIELHGHRHVGLTGQEHGIGLGHSRSGPGGKLLQGAFRIQRNRFAVLFQGVEVLLHLGDGLSGDLPVRMVDIRVGVGVIGTHGQVLEINDILGGKGAGRGLEVALGRGIRIGLVHLVHHMVMVVGENYQQVMEGISLLRRFLDTGFKLRLDGAQIQTKVTILHQRHCLPLATRQQTDGQQHPSDMREPFHQSNTTLSSITSVSLSQGVTWTVRATRLGLRLM